MRGSNRLFVFTIFALLGALAPLSARAQVPGQIPIQGYLTDAEGEPYDADVAITFTIYDAATGGTELFSERQTIIVDRGVFSAYLGAVEALDLSIFRDSGSLYLGVQVGADAEASPRLQFGTVPWAAYSDAAATFGGVAASELPTVVDEWAREACLDTEEELTALLDDNYANPAWDSITGVPADIADGDDGFTTEEELTGLLDDNYAAEGHTHGWDELTDVPAGFADGTDDGFTTEGELTALLDDNYLDAGWTPSWGDISGIPDGLGDGDDDTTYTAGEGLVLDGTEFAVEFDGPGEATTAARSDAMDDLTDRVDGLEENMARRPTGAVYRWQVFSTYLNDWGWVMGNDPNLHGGVHPSNWTDGNYRAVHMSREAEVLRTLLTRKGYGGTNAMVHSEVFHQFSSTNGRVIVALFRIRNTTDHNISWRPFFYHTCYSGWAERASVAINGGEVWNSGGTNCSMNSASSLTITVPADRISTIIFVATSTVHRHITSNIYVRYVNLTFYNNSLRLPEGLEYVDDLDSVEGRLW